MSTITPTEAVLYARDAFSDLAEPDNAAIMAAYMKTEMPFFGIKKPLRLPVQRELRRRLKPLPPEVLEAVAVALWAEPERELKYLALDLAKAIPTHTRLEALPLYEHWIRDGAWWDFVDLVAIHLVGRLLLAHPEEMEPVMDRWIDDPDMWIRRTAIIARVHHGEQRDEARLFEACEKRMHESEFFIRKAIGWALRQHAYDRPRQVHAFVAAQGDAMSGLTRREATKHLERLLAEQERREK